MDQSDRAEEMRLVLGLPTLRPQSQDEKPEAAPKLPSPSSISYSSIVKGKPKLRGKPKRTPGGAKTSSGFTLDFDLAAPVSDSSQGFTFGVPGTSSSSLEVSFTPTTLPPTPSQHSSTGAFDFPNLIIATPLHFQTPTTSSSSSSSGFTFQF